MPIGIGVALDILEIWLRGGGVGDVFNSGLVEYVYIFESHFRVLLNHSEQSGTDIVFSNTCLAYSTSSSASHTKVLGERSSRLNTSHGACHDKIICN